MNGLDEFRRTVGGFTALDLTPDNQVKTMKRLRRKDPNEARQVERRLQGYLAMVSRERPWIEASHGRKGRLKFLPENPHFLGDCQVCRDELGLKSPIDRLIPREMFEGLDDVRRQWLIREYTAAWVSAHRAASSGNAALSPALDTNSAVVKHGELVAKTVLAKTEVEWLREPPGGQPPHDRQAAPFDWVVGRMLERYCLPWNVGPSVGSFILTGNVGMLKGLEKFAYAEVAGVPANRELVFSMVGVDEYTTVEDRDGVWRDQVGRWDRQLWHQDGQRPAGKRAPDLARLGQWLPLYQRMVLYEEEPRLALEALRERAERSGKGTFPQKSERAMRSAITNLDALLRPRESSK